MIDQYQHTMREIITTMPNDHGDFPPCPELLTEHELALFLGITEVSN